MVFDQIRLAVDITSTSLTRVLSPLQLVSPCPPNDTCPGFKSVFDERFEMLRHDHRKANGIM